MSLTPQELSEHDAAAERRVRDAEFAKAHPELFKTGLVSLFWQGVHEVSEGWQEMPQRLRGRGVWLKERGRIKDAELMFDAATEIDELRRQAATRSAA